MTCPTPVTDDLTVSIYNHDLSVFAAPGVIVVTASDGFRNDAVSVHMPIEVARQFSRHVGFMIREAERLEAEAGRRAVWEPGNTPIRVDIPAPAQNVVAFRWVPVVGAVR